ncbi:MAG TPA: SCP2 sterol-binding domain-containing protein [Actinomycetota bacterium]|nr:SCP2 sterol-binding domain-containing protein [Actinomycetota bacterium]
MAVKFQSDEYFAAANEALQRDEAVAKAAKGHTVALQVTTTDFPGVGDKKSYVRIEKGVINVGPGEVEDPDVNITQNYDVAVLLDKGELNPQVAFMEGKIKLKGNLMKAMSLQKLLSAIGPATSHIEREY